MMKASFSLLPKPVPPVSGWTLMEALEALCPWEAHIFADFGFPLIKAVRVMGDADDLSLYLKMIDGTRAEAWIAARLAAALAIRSDLELTGINLANGTGGLRFRSGPNLLWPALNDPTKRMFGFRANKFGIKRKLFLHVHTDEASIQFDVEAAFGSPPTAINLIEVRIETVSNVSRAATPQLPPIEAAVAENNDVKAKWDDETGRQWLKQRRDSWPKGTPAPSEEVCLTAVKAHFDRVTREQFREIRREVARPDWLKRGPRGPRKNSGRTLCCRER